MNTHSTSTTPNDDDSFIESYGNVSIIRISPSVNVGAPLSVVKNLPDSAEWTGTYSLETHCEDSPVKLVIEEPITLKINFKEKKIHATALLKQYPDRTLTLDADFNAKKTGLVGKFDVNTSPIISGQIAGKIGDDCVFIILDGNDSDGIKYAGSINADNPV